MFVMLGLAWDVSKVCANSPHHLLQANFPLQRVFDFVKCSGYECLRGKQEKARLHSHSSEQICFCGAASHKSEGSMIEFGVLHVFLGGQSKECMRK